MNPEALRIALRAEEAWETLTDRQTETVRAFVLHKTVAATARALGVSRQAVYDALRLAGAKFLAFARAVEDAGAA